jgi:hypothetical protein
MKYLLLIFLNCCCLLGFSQTTKVDTVSFRFENGLLVFKGKLNNVDADFAFDTGAFSTVSNTTNNVKAGVKIITGKKSIVDANQTVAKINNVKFDDLTIASFHFKNLKALTFDMPFLNCADLILLGQDVIKKLNWKIDFNKKVLYVSESAFSFSKDMDAWPVTYKNNRPHVSFQIQGVTYQNCLIDFGFNGVFDVNMNVAKANDIYESKLKLNKVNQLYTSNIGLMGFGKPVKTDDFILDSIYFNKALFKNVLISRDEKNDIKLGAQFFNKFCSQLILNFSTNTFYIKPKVNTSNYNPSFDARPTIQNGKFIITDKNITQNSTAKNLEIGEEIKSVNGKLITDFKNECEYLLWLVSYSGNEFLLEKLDGKKIIVKRSSVLVN